MTVPAGMTFRDDSQEAFKDAIDAGKLSASPTSPVYAGRYMYMWTQHGVDVFKNTDTRKYDVTN